jgi:uncharacterized protein (DUF3820 family)
MQPNPFPKKNHRRKPKQKKEKRIWQTWDRFPFGTHQGKLLVDLAKHFPDHLLWWQKNRQVLFSDALLEEINRQKLLAQ